MSRPAHPDIMSNPFIFLGFGIMGVMMLAIGLLVLLVVGASFRQSAVIMPLFGSCSVAGAVCALVCFTLYFRLKRRQDSVKDIADFLAIHRRASPEAISQAAGVPLADVDRLVMEATRSGLMHAAFDPDSRAFVLASDIRAGSRVVRCTSCGAPSVAPVAAGPPGKCQYCGSPLPSAGIG